MVTVYRNDANSPQPVGPAADGTGYTSYKEPDTRVPPKPLPVMDAISVDGTAIAESEILQEAQHHPAENPGEALRAAAQALVVRQLLINEAARLGYSDDAPATEDGRQEAPEEAAIQTLLDGELNVPAATEDECRRYYENNPSRFISPALHEARHILIAASEDDPQKREKAHALAQNICDLLQADPGRFTELAKMHSACPSAKNGGNLGQLAPGGTVAEFESALNEMVPGTISRAPVASRYGYHIIALERSIEPKKLPFEAVQDRISVWLEAQAWSRASAQYVSILAGRAKITGIDFEGSENPLVQ